MHALYQCGRQADALDVYQRAREHLIEGLGLEPGPELQALQSQILAHAPSLKPAAIGADTRAGAAPAARHPLGLPAPRTPVLGRAADTKAIVEMLLGNEVRLVTVLGAGGVGKTTVAIEAARRAVGAFVDGAVFVDLAPIADAGRVAEAIALALGCTPEPGVTGAETLRGVLVAREQLLVLDNFEHLLGAASLLNDLLDVAPRLALLVTSRAALDLRAEHRYPLAPLALPSSSRPDAVEAAAATALFIARARAKDPAFRLSASSARAIATMCARVDGLPLAIELTAARCGVFEPEEIAERLDQLLPSPGPAPRDAPQRQQTLHATLDWSYQLLDERERAAFVRLATFAGGCSVEAAEYVTGATVDVLERLVTKSMLQRRAANGESRLEMLQPIHEYATQRLAEDAAADEVAERHSRYYLRFAEAAVSATTRLEQLERHRRLDAESDNLRAALSRDRRQGAIERVLRIATALEDWWQDRASWVDGARWIEDALEAAGAGVPFTLRADSLRVLAQLRVHTANLAATRTSAEAALALYRTADDKPGVANCLALLAAVYTELGDPAAGYRAAAEAVRVSQVADTRTRAFALQTLAGTTPNLRAATSAADEAAVLYRQDNDHVGLSRLWATLGRALLARGGTADAEPFLQRSFELATDAQDIIGATFALGKLAILAVENEQDDLARDRLAETLGRCRTHGLRRPVAESLSALAAIAARNGDPKNAATLAGAATAARSGQALDPTERRIHAAVLEPVRHEIGDSGWEMAYEAGRRLGVEEALALGLQIVEQRIGTESRPVAALANPHRLATPQTRNAKRTD
jgi:predicted ATPase